jgi:hypothetical protein
MKPPRTDHDRCLTEQCWLGIGCLLVWAVLIMSVSRCSGGEVKLAWNPNPESDLSGYRVYRIGPPNLMLVATTATTATVTAFPGEEVAVSAFNAAGESDLSAPVTIPEPPPTTPELDRAGWTVAGFSSEEFVRENGAAWNSIDAAGITTYWNSNWDQRGPHYIAIKLPRAAMVSGLRYTPWQGAVVDDGYIQAWQLQSSMDGIEWEDWAAGTWPNTRDRKTETLPLREVRYFRMWGNERYASASDLVLLGSYVPDAPIPMVRLTMQQSENLRSWADIAHDPITVPKKAADFFRLKIETP